VRFQESRKSLPHNRVVSTNPFDDLLYAMTRSNSPGAKSQMVELKESAPEHETEVPT